VSVIVVNNFCDNIKKIILFDSKSQFNQQCYDLESLTNFLFQVFEPGITNPIIEIGNSNISISAQYYGYGFNTVNVQIKEQDLKGLIPNSYNQDRIREYRLFATDEDGMKLLLKQDCFYIEDSLTGMPCHS
jgi:hypothetical protein